MKRVAILGLGLMGGSLGLAIKARKLGWHVAGHTRTAERGRRALKRGAVDSLHANPVEAVKDADLVVLCGPVLALARQAVSCRAGLKPGAVVTDVGSTKTVVEREMADVLSGTVDFKAALDFLLKKGKLTGEEWFNGVAFGVEPIRGSGSLELRKLDVSYE